MLSVNRDSIISIIGAEKSHLEFPEEGKEEDL